MKKLLLSIIIIAFITMNLNAQLKVLTNGYIGLGNLSPIEQIQIGDRFVFSNGGTKYLGYNSYYNSTDKRIVTAV